jgi:hypothetical protein
LRGTRWQREKRLALPPRDGLVFPEFFFDSLTRFGRDSDELNADPYADQTVGNLAAELEFELRTNQAELYLEYGAFGEMVTGLNEHAAHAEVRRTMRNLFELAFVGDGQVTKMAIVALVLARGDVNFGLCRAIHAE